MVIQQVICDVIRIDTAQGKALDAGYLVFTAKVSLQHAPVAPVFTGVGFVQVGPVGFVMFDIVQVFRIVVGVWPFQRGIPQDGKACQPVVVAIRHAGIIPCFYAAVEHDTYFQAVSHFCSYVRLKIGAFEKEFPAQYRVLVHVGARQIIVDAVRTAGNVDCWQSG